MENITTEGVMNKQYIFRDFFRKVDEFGWWYMEIIKTGAGPQFIFKKFKEGFLCTWFTNCIRGTIPSGNECPS